MNISFINWYYSSLSLRWLRFSSENIKFCYERDKINTYLYLTSLVCVFHDIDYFRTSAQYWLIQKHVSNFFKFSTNVYGSIRTISWSCNSVGCIEIKLNTKLMWENRLLLVRLLVNNNQNTHLVQSLCAKST